MKSTFTSFKFALFVIGYTFSCSLSAQDLEEEGEQTVTKHTSYIEIGAGSVSDDSFKFGEYNGLQEEGTYFIGNLDIRKKSDMYDEDATYWRLSGSDLGLDTGSLYGEYTKEGNYSLNFEYDQIPHNKLDNVWTPFNGAGTADQALPSDWVAANSTAGMTNLADSLMKTEIKTERHRSSVGFKWLLNNNWKLDGDFRREIKDGSDTIGAIFGTTGGNPRASILAMPIDYQTNDSELGISYTGKKSQYRFNFHLSQFENNNAALIWDNPFLRPAGNAWAVGTDYAAGARGALELPPDNEATQFHFAGGYNFSRSTRLTANLSSGKMQQNDLFLPYTNIPTLTVTIPQPRSSLNGEIDTLYANINLSSHLSNKLNLIASFTKDERDNNTPRDTYVRIAGDAENQGALVSASARVNWPYSYERRKFELKADYRVLSQTKLTIGYVNDEKDRVFSEVETTEEDTVSLRLSNNTFETINGWIEFEQSTLGGSDYVSNQPFIDGHNPDYIATLTGAELYENDPLMRKFNIANRDRDKLDATINFVPIDSLTFSVIGKQRQDKFPDTELGLQNADTSSLTFDVSFNPIDVITTYAYFTRENNDYKQRGDERGGTEYAPGDVRNPDNAWTIETEDEIDTVGVGLNWIIIEDKFNMAIDYSDSDATTQTTPFSTGIAFEPLPDLTTEIRSITLKSDFSFSESMTIRLSYLHEKFNSTDFALDNVAVDTLANVILMGNTSPQYDVNVVGVSLIYAFN